MAARMRLWRRLGVNQQSVARALWEHRLWRPGCGWYWSSRSRTAHLMRTLVRAGWATEDGGTYQPTPEADEFFNAEDRRQAKRVEARREAARHRTEVEAAEKAALARVVERFAGARREDLPRMLNFVQTGYSWTDVLEWIEKGGLR